MKKKQFKAGLIAAAIGLLAGSANAQAILTAETGPPGTVPFTAMTTLAEIVACVAPAGQQAIWVGQQRSRYRRNDRLVHFGI